MTLDWAAVGTAAAVVEGRWRRLLPSKPFLRLAGATGWASVELRSGGGGGAVPELLSPKAALRAWLRPLRPKAALVRPLGLRDAWPALPVWPAQPAPQEPNAAMKPNAAAAVAASGGASGGVRMFELVLEYAFEQPKAKRVTPHLAVAHGEVYDSIFAVRQPR